MILMYHYLDHIRSFRDGLVTAHIQNIESNKGVTCKINKLFCWQGTVTIGLELYYYFFSKPMLTVTIV